MASSGIIVREMKPADIRVWNAFVSNHSERTFCHRAEWKDVIQEGARQLSPYLLAEKDASIVGVLPLTHRKSWLFGNGLTSSMFCVYGGVLAIDDDAHDALVQTAWRYAQDHNINAVEYRSIKAHHRDEPEWHIEDSAAATFIKPLKNTDEDILLDIPRKQRAVVRKSLKNNLVSNFEPDLDTFYRLYSESVRNLGTPVFPKALFAAMLKHFGEDCEIQIVRTQEGEAVASLMSFYSEDSVLPYYAGGGGKNRALGAHDFMYYQLMVRAAEKGKKYFDFGRSKVGTGPYKFKKNWGFEPTPLAYEYQLASGAEKPTLDPNSGKYRLMVQTWKKLPLFIANAIGPYLSRHLG